MRFGIPRSSSSVPLTAVRLRPDLPAAGRVVQRDHQRRSDNSCEPVGLCGFRNIRADSQHGRRHNRDRRGSRGGRLGRDFALLRRGKGSAVEMTRLFLY